MNTRTETAPEILEARKKFAEKFGNTKLGGKGTEKKKKLVAHRSTAVQDKKISALAKKARKYTSKSRGQENR